jgi:hypothetical protein
MGKGSLTVRPWGCKPLVCRSQQRGGAAQGQAPFYSVSSPDNLTTNTRFYLFTSTHESLNGHFIRSIARLSSR